MLSYVLEVIKYIVSNILFYIKFDVALSYNSFYMRFGGIPKLVKTIEVQPIKFVNLLKVFQ